MKYTCTLPAVLSILFLMSLAPPTLAQDLTSQFDELLGDRYVSDGPGAAVLVVKQGQVIYRKGFGMANLELEVPMTPEHVFEIGSITKQFTSIAILMLLEQGKLNLKDEITKYLPAYPTHGKSITIHHLLNHTSGIKSYTSLNLMDFARKDLSPIEVIDLFKDEPMDFDPGTQWSYNNSGYILLGYIIEHVSSTSYEDFIEENIFKPAGMDHSRYGHKGELIKMRASGYQNSDGFENASYLSMTLPYAAGSLMSTVDDLYKWQQALLSQKFISNETLEKAYKNYPLDNGKLTNYGYGFRRSNINGTATIEHGGGIFGYTTYQIYVPSEDVHVAILTNCNCNSPTNITVEIAALAIGKPYAYLRQSVKVDPEKMKKLVGVYEFEDSVTRYITFSDGQLFSQREGSTKLKIFPIDESHYYFEGGFTKLAFKRKRKKVTVMFDDRDESGDFMGMKVDKPLPQERVSIEVAPEILAKYVGVYEVRPGFDMTITLEDGTLHAQATGQSKLQLHAETESMFFVKEFPAAMEFGSEEHGVTNVCTLHQGGAKTPAQRKSD